MPKRKQIFEITIPKPCSAEWDKMEKREHGRFCNDCRKIVVDFSQLSDKELYQYFSTTKTIPCGRFHTSQLNSNLIPVKGKKYPWTKWYRSIAALVAFLSLKNSHAANNKTETITIQPSVNKKHLFLPGKVTITGTVKDHHGAPLENASIKIDEKEMGRTDKDGKFEFQLDISNSTQSYTLVFSYPGLIRTARSYHSAMQSTSYDVMMEPVEHYNNCHTGGWPVIITDIFPPFSVYFNKKTILTNELKKELSLLAMKMRQNPDVKINLVAYANTKAEKTLAKKRQDMILDFFSDQEGIATSRFIYVVEQKLPENEQLIEIRAVSRD